MATTQDLQKQESQKHAAACNRLRALLERGDAVLVREPKNLAYPATLTAHAEASSGDYAVYATPHALEGLRRAEALTTREWAGEGQQQKAYVKHAIATQVLAEAPQLGEGAPDAALLALELAGRQGVRAAIAARPEAALPHYLLCSARQEGDLKKDRERLSDGTFELLSPQMRNPDGGVFLALPISRTVAEALRRADASLTDLSAELAAVARPDDPTGELYALSARLQGLAQMHYHAPEKEAAQPAKKVKPAPVSMAQTKPLDSFFEQLAPHVTRLEYRYRLGKATQLLLHTDGDAAIEKLAPAMGSHKSCKTPIMLKAYSNQAHCYLLDTTEGQARLLAHPDFAAQPIHERFIDTDYHTPMHAQEVVYQKGDWMPTGQVAMGRTPRQEMVHDLQVMYVGEGAQSQPYLYITGDSRVRLQRYVGAIHGTINPQHGYATGEQVIPAICRIAIAPALAEHLMQEKGIPAYAHAYATLEKADQGACVRAHAQRVAVKATPAPAYDGGRKDTRDPRAEAAKVIFGQAVRQRLLLKPNLDRGKKPSLRKVRLGLQVPVAQSKQFREQLQQSGFLDKKHPLQWLERVEGLPPVDLFVLQLSASDAQHWQEALAPHQRGNSDVQLSENSMTEAKAIIRERLHDTRRAPAKSPEEMAWHELIGYARDGTLQSVRLVYTADMLERDLSERTMLAEALRKLAAPRHAAQALLPHFQQAEHGIRLPIGQRQGNPARGLERHIASGARLEADSAALEAETQALQAWLQAQPRDRQGNVVIDCLTYLHGQIPVIHFDQIAARQNAERDAILEEAKQKRRPYAQLPEPYFHGESFSVDGIRGRDVAAVLRPVSSEFIHQLRRRGGGIALPSATEVAWEALQAHANATWGKDKDAKTVTPAPVAEPASFSREAARKKLMTGLIDQNRELFTLGSIRDGLGRPQSAMVFTLKSRAEWTRMLDLREQLDQAGMLLHHAGDAGALPTYTQQQQQALQDIMAAKDRIEAIEGLTDLLAKGQLGHDFSCLQHGEPLYDPAAFHGALGEAIAALEAEGDARAEPLLGILRAMAESGATLPLYSDGLEAQLEAFIAPLRTERMALKDKIPALRKANHITDHDVAMQVSQRRRDQVHYFQGEMETPEFQDVKRAADKYFQGAREETGRDEPPYQFGVFLNLPNLELDRQENEANKQLLQKLLQQAAIHGPQTQLLAQRRRPGVYDAAQQMLRAAVTGHTAERS
jgi:hypothetical protein